MRIEADIAHDVAFSIEVGHYLNRSARLQTFIRID